MKQPSSRSTDVPQSLLDAAAVGREEEARRKTLAPTFNVSTMAIAAFADANASNPSAWQICRRSTMSMAAR